VQWLIVLLHSDATNIHVQKDVLNNEERLWESKVLQGIYLPGKGYIAKLPIIWLKKDNHVMYMQQFSTGGFTIYYCKGEIAGRFSEIFTVNEAYVFCIIVLSGIITVTLSTAGRKVLYAGQANVLYAAKDFVTVSSDRAQKINVFVLLIRREQLHMQLRLFEAAQEIAVSLRNKEACYLTDENVYLYGRMYDLISRITETRFDENSSEIYDAICRTLLLTIVVSTLKYSKTKKNGAGDIKQKAAEVRRIIDEHLDVHYRVDELARKVGLNSKVMKLAFRTYYGKGVYEYLKFKRMKACFTALQETKQPMKYIAKQYGYKSIHSFMRTFKQSFGKTPGEVRREGTRSME